MAGSLRIPTTGQHVAAHLFGLGNGDGGRLHEFLVKGLVVPLNERVHSIVVPLEQVPNGLHSM